MSFKVAVPLLSFLPTSDLFSKVFRSRMRLPVALLLAQILPPLQAQTAIVTATPVVSGFSSAALAVDGTGNIYITDASNNAVKEISVGCTTYSCATTLGGGFSGPTGVAVDSSGNVYVADYGNKAVKEMPAGCTSSTCVTSLGGWF